MCVGRYAEKMQWSEAKWNLFEMPAIRWANIMHSSGMRHHQNLLIAKLHPAGMHICYAAFAGISLRLCFISLRSFRTTFAAYLPTHI